MIETEEQRRWWFATHPEYSRHGGGKRRKKDEDDESEEGFTPESVDAYVDRNLKYYEHDSVATELLKQVKFWLGTEFESKPLTEQRLLLWGEEDDGEGDDWADDKSGSQGETAQPSRHPALSRDSYDKYEDVQDRMADYGWELFRLAIEQDKKGIIADPITALDLFPYRRLATAPLDVFKGMLKRLAEGAVVNAAKEGRKGWKLGDHHQAPTYKGTEPVWPTERARYWKNEAFKEGAIGKHGEKNVTFMKGGSAPQRRNPQTGESESMELHHHPTPRRHGGKEFIEVWPEEHSRMDPQRRLRKR